MSLMPPELPSTARPVGSLIALTQGHAPEVPAILCVDPIETAADKLSALAWRVHARRRGNEQDDPTIIRHLHDLAALKAAITASTDFVPLVRKAMEGDVGRGGDATASSDHAALLAGMLERLSTDRRRALGPAFVSQGSMIPPTFGRSLNVIVECSCVPASRSLG
jgi:hypothetical protein